MAQVAAQPYGDIRIEPGTYALRWEDLSDIGDLGTRSPLHPLNTAGSPGFVGLSSTKARWARTDHYLVALDESRGTDKGYDVLYLFSSRRSAPIVPSENREVGDGIRVPLKQFQSGAESTNRRTLVVTTGLEPWLVPAQPGRVNTEVRVGDPAAGVALKSVLDIAVYKWKDGPGEIKIALKSGWLGTLRTNAGPRTVLPLDKNGNGLYNDAPHPMGDKAWFSGDRLLLEMPTGSAEEVAYDQPVTYGEETCLFFISSDGSTLTVRSDEGREQAAVSKAVSEFSDALRRSDWTAASEFVSDDFKRESKWPADGTLLRFDSHSGKTWQSVLASDTAKIGKVEIRGTWASATVQAGGDDPQGQIGIMRVQLTKENGNWRLQRLPYGPHQPGPPVAVRRDVGLKVLTLLPKDGTISAHEPLVAKLQLSNLTKSALRIPIAGILSTRVEVYDRDGKLVGATPIEPVPLDMLVSELRLTSGETRVRWVVLSALYQFTKPGDYKVRIQMLNPDTGRTVLAETDTQVRVLPFNSSRLRARCEEIFSPLRSLPQNLESFPMRTRLQALYSVRNDAVLPYLGLIAREWDQSSHQWPAMMCIRRINSKEAEKLFETLTARNDHVGEVARKVAKATTPERIDEWYVGGEWSR